MSEVSREDKSCWPSHTAASRSCASINTLIMLREVDVRTCIDGKLQHLWQESIEGGQIGALPGKRGRLSWYETFETDFSVFHAVTRFDRYGSPLEAQRGAEGLCRAIESLHGETRSDASDGRDCRHVRLTDSQRSGMEMASRQSIATR